MSEYEWQYQWYYNDGDPLDVEDQPEQCDSQYGLYDDDYSQQTYDYTQNKYRNYAYYDYDSREQNDHPLLKQYAQQDYQFPKHTHNYQINKYTQPQYQQDQLRPKHVYGQLSNNSEQQQEQQQEQQEQQEQQKQQEQQEQQEQQQYFYDYAQQYHDYLLNIIAHQHFKQNLSWGVDKVGNTLKFKAVEPITYQGELQGCSDIDVAFVREQLNSKKYQIHSKLHDDILVKIKCSPDNPPQRFIRFHVKPTLEHLKIQKEPDEEEDIK